MRVSLSEPPTTSGRTEIYNIYDVSNGSESPSGGGVGPTNERTNGRTQVNSKVPSPLSRGTNETTSDPFQRQF